MSESRYVSGNAFKLPVLKLYNLFWTLVSAHISNMTVISMETNRRKKLFFLHNIFSY